MSSRDLTFSRRWPVVDALVRFWRSDKGLSIFSAWLLVFVFVLPPFFPPRPVAPSSVTSPIALVCSPASWPSPSTGSPGGC